MKDVSNSVTVMSGVLSVMTFGEQWMHKLLVDSWDLILLVRSS